MPTMGSNPFDPKSLRAERLDGIGCVVTGGVSGIGFEVARELARLGGAIGIIDLHEEAAKSAAFQIEKDCSCTRNR